MGGDLTGRDDEVQDLASTRIAAAPREARAQVERFEQLDEPPRPPGLPDLAAPAAGADAVRRQRRRGRRIPAHPVVPTGGRPLEGRSPLPASSTGWARA